MDAAIAIISLLALGMISACASLGTARSLRLQLRHKVILSVYGRGLEDAIPAEDQPATYAIGNVVMLVASSLTALVAMACFLEVGLAFCGVEFPLMSSFVRVGSPCG